MKKKSGYKNIGEMICFEKILNKRKNTSKNVPKKYLFVVKKVVSTKIFTRKFYVKRDKECLSLTIPVKKKFGIKKMLVPKNFGAKKIYVQNVLS